MLQSQPESSTLLRRAISKDDDKTITSLAFEPLVPTRGDRAIWAEYALRSRNGDDSTHDKIPRQDRILLDYLDYLDGNSE